MSRSTIAAVTILLFVCGCQSTMVRHGANQLASTAPDLYYAEVLDNLARACAEPNVLPYFGTPNQGTHLNARQLQANWTPSLTLIGGSWRFDKQSFGLTAQNQDQESFQLLPISDPDKLSLMQAAYHERLGNATGDQTYLLSRFYAERNPPEAMTPGGGDPITNPPNLLRYDYWRTRPQWFGIAYRKKDVPKEACYVGQHCGCYVYVEPGRESDFTEFTLAILDIATLDTKGARPLGAAFYKLLKELEEANAKLQEEHKKLDQEFENLKGSKTDEARQNHRLEIERIKARIDSNSKSVESFKTRLQMQHLQSSPFLPSRAQPNVISPPPTASP